MLKVLFNDEFSYTSKSHLSCKVHFFIDCKALAYPPNGAFSPSDVKEGTVLTVVCDTGYTLLGDAVINCLPGGLWDNYPPDCHRGKHFGNSATIRESNHGAGVCKIITRTTMYQKAPFC